MIPSDPSIPTTIWSTQTISCDALGYNAIFVVVVVVVAISLEGQLFASRDTHCIVVGDLDLE